MSDVDQSQGSFKSGQNIKEELVASNYKQSHVSESAFVKEVLRRSENA